MNFIYIYIYIHSIFRFRNGFFFSFFLKKKEKNKKKGGLRGERKQKKTYRIETTVSSSSNAGKIGDGINALLCEGRSTNNNCSRKSGGTV
jgi:hypothetical protein